MQLHGGHAEWKEVSAVSSGQNIIVYGLRDWVSDRDVPGRRAACADEDTCWQHKLLSVMHWLHDYMCEV